MKLRKFFVYVDDGTENALKIAVPAKNEKYAREYCLGCGEIVAIKDVTDEYGISLLRVDEALANAGFTRIERDFIERTLLQTDISNTDQ